MMRFCSAESPLPRLPLQVLGLPLSLRKLESVEVQPLIDRIAARLPAWKGKLLDKAGRLTLVKSVLSSVPIYFLTVFPLKKWAIKILTRSEEVSFGKEKN